MDLSPKEVHDKHRNRSLFAVFFAFGREDGVLRFFLCVRFTKAVAQKKKRGKERAFPTERLPCSVETLKKKDLRQTEVRNALN